MACKSKKCCPSSKDVGQSKKMSGAEVALSTAIGYVIAITSQYVIFPVFGIYIPLHEHMIIGVFFTIVSVIRSYYVRRLFNYLHVKGALK